MEELVGGALWKTPKMTSSQRDYEEVNRKEWIWDAKARWGIPGRELLMDKKTVS